MGTQTHSKAPREALRGLEPCFVVRGKGCRVWDLDGNEYIDFRNGLCPITLGYRFPSVDEAIRRPLDEGIVFSYPHPLEVEVAERLVEVIPCAERVPVGQLVVDPDDPQRDAELFLRFNAEVLTRGIIIYSICYPNYSHAVADVDAAVEAMGEALDAMHGEGLFD